MSAEIPDRGREAAPSGGRETHEGDETADRLHRIGGRPDLRLLARSLAARASPNVRRFATDETVWLRHEGKAVRGTVIGLPRPGSQEYTVRTQAGVTVRLPATSLWHTSEVTARSNGRDIPPAAMVALLERRAAYMERYGEKSGLIDNTQFEEMFRGEFFQSAIHNCYLAAALGALRRSPHFPELMRTSIRRTKDDLGWQIHLPLGSAKGRWITVTDAQLNSEERVTEGGRTRVLGPLKGATGWKLLEAAYTFNRPGAAPADRTRKGSEYGHGEHVFEFFFGKDDKRMSDNQSARNDAAPLSTTPENRAIAQRILQNYSTTIDLGTALSKKLGDKSDSTTFLARDASGATITLRHNHVYTIQSVDAAARTVTISDPHHNQPVILAWDRFFAEFRGIGTHRLRHRDLFTVPEKK